MLNIPYSQSIAVLVDAENTQLELLNHVLKFADSFGVRKISRAYGHWEEPSLSAWRDTVDKFSIEIVPVEAIGKDTADDVLKFDAVEILCEGQIDVFIIVAGDGDFRLLCKRIQEKGRKVIGISNEGRASSYLKEICDSFYYIENLSKLNMLKSNLGKVPIQIEQSRLQEFEALFFQALAQLCDDSFQDIELGQLGNTLRELDPDFEHRFGDYKQSEWLSNFSQQLRIYDNRIQITKSKFLKRIILLLKAYQQACADNGLSNVGQMGKILHQIDSQFFAGKRPSEWLDMYPHIFNRKGNDVRLVSTTI